MAKVQKSIDINAPLQPCFDQWMRFEEFPQFMHHVKSIIRQGNNRWHWVVDGPLGTKLEWDAEMDGKVEDRMISWHSVANPTVSNQGEVRFDEVSPNTTRITATIQYEPPAGAAGEVIAKLFSNPDQMVQEDLDHFKKLIEQKAPVAGVRTTV